MMRASPSWIIVLFLLFATALAAEAQIVEEIRFEGAESFHRSTLLRLMRTRESSAISTPLFRPDLFTRDLDNLAAFYLSQGFLEVKILAHPASYSWDSTAVVLRVAIMEGPRWTISETRCSGIEAFTFREICGQLKLQKGTPYRPSFLMTDQQAILDEYASRGYLDTRITQDVIAQPEAHSVSLHYEIDEGPPATVSRITIRGLEKTRPATVLRELEFCPGDRFDLRKWGRSQSNLYNTGLFAWVWIQPASEDENKPEKEVLILVGEKPRWEFSAGAGYGRFDQARLVAGVRQNNFFGRGVRFGLEGKVSERTRMAELVISEPWLFGRRIASNASAVYRRRDEPEFLAESVEGALVLSKALRTRVLLEGGYRLKRTTLLRVSAGAEDRDRRNRTSVLGAALSWKMRDDLFNTTRGFFLRFEGEYAGSFLGGTNQFLRANAFWRHFLRLPGNVIIAFNTRFGAMTPLHSNGDIPINERYFLGGDRSVRGYPRHSLGPEDTAGNPVGGRKLIELGQEFRVPVGRRLRLVLFSDQGMLFNSDPHRDDWAVGAGGGLRIITPFGVLRAEAARGLTERWGIVTEYYLSVGQAF